MLHSLANNKEEGLQLQASQPDEVTTSLTVHEIQKLHLIRRGGQ